MSQNATEKTTPRVSIIVPTYHEVENLPHLIARIKDVAETHEFTAELLIVDDDSQDGSEELVAALQLPWVRMIVRKEDRGLSRAVLEGIGQARGDALLVMDADLSHPPEKIPELLEAIDEGYDFVIGSRHVKGATTDENWGTFRWLNSFAATMLAKPFVSVRDPMSGFFAFPRRTLDRADYLNPIGYKIGLELIVKCHCRSVIEIPISFTDRVRGDSKLSLREQVNYLRHLLRLYQFRYRNRTLFLQFALVGASGVVVDLTLLAMLWKVLSVPYPVARAAAIWAAMTWNFVWNRRWTFSYASTGSLVGQYVGFCASCLLGAVLNLSTRVSLIEYAEIFVKRPLLAALVGVGVGMVSNFVLCRFAVFRKPRRPPAADEPKAETGPCATERSPTTVDQSGIDQEGSENKNTH